MKRIIAPFFLIFTLSFAWAQNGQEWFHGSIDYGFYGVNTDKAYEYLKTINRKAQPIIVGVLDSGVEPDHEDLKTNMWVNNKEIPNNKIDDDKNGYIDDINGWNFLGNPNGQNVSGDNLEMVRLYKEYLPLFEGKSEKIIKKNIKKYPEKYKIYVKAKAKIEEKRKDAEINGGEYRRIKGFVEKSFAEDIMPALGNESYTMAKLNEKTSQMSNPQIQKLFTSVYKQYFDNNTKKTATAEEVFQYTIQDIQEAIDHYENGSKYNYNPDLDTRKIVGDNYTDKKQRNYGNNDVEGPDALHGTHVAGLIAAQRNNGKGINGISDAARIMAVRVVPDGDERDKDVANGIYYAVNNGAKIINMSFGKAYSPEKYLVDDAIKYAEQKGVLMLHAAGNDGLNIDIEAHFPDHATNGNIFANNWITVGASTQKGNQKLPASFSNYGKKSVDIFAPGVAIYSSTPDSKYRILQGTSMATPIASGIAALVWSYFPELSMSELRTILLQSVNVYKESVIVPNESDAIIPDKAFTELSTTGGVIDAYLAVKNADEYLKQKKSK